jgi:hypothetical protein
MSSIPVPAPLYRRPPRSAVDAKEAEEARFVTPFRRHRRTVRSLREQILSDPLYIRHQII